MNSNDRSDWPWSKIALTLAVILALTAGWKFLPMHEWSQSAIEWVEGLGVWGYLAFVVIYLVGALIGFPRTPLNVGAGIIFGFGAGLCTVALSSAAANFMTFEIARHVAHDWVCRRISKIPNAQKIMEAVEREGFKMVFLLRMNPFIPAVLKGYGFGTTNLKFPTYMAASVLGSLPILTAHVYLGHLGGAAMMSSAEQPEQWRSIVMVGGGIVSVIGVAVISWYAHRALHKHELEAA